MTWVEWRMGRHGKQREGEKTYPFTIRILPSLPRSIEVLSIKTNNCDSKNELEEAEDEVGEVGFGGGEGDGHFGCVVVCVVALGAFVVWNGAQ